MCMYFYLELDLKNMLRFYSMLYANYQCIHVYHLQQKATSFHILKSIQTETPQLLLLFASLIFRTQKYLTAADHLPGLCVEWFFWQHEQKAALKVILFSEFQ